MVFVIYQQELEAIKARVREMEAEAEKLKEMQSEVEKQMNLSSPTSASTACKFYQSVVSHTVFGTWPAHGYYFLFLSLCLK